MNSLDDFTSTITKTIMTARLFEGFWDRWIAHGLHVKEVSAMKGLLKNIDDWETHLKYCAEKHSGEAENFNQRGLRSNAENSYRTAALYYNLIQWIYPQRCEKKINWYRQSNALVAQADKLSDITCVRESIEIDNTLCIGRIRIPEMATQCIIIVNPIDSTKEELYSYEKQFIEAGFITISFDGPGQGETYIDGGLTATEQRWHLFMNKVIESTVSRFPTYPIYLFGTSSGAAWAIHGSTDPRVVRVAAVSPPVEDGASMPNYFGERLSFIVETGESIVPDLSDSSAYRSVLLFHGNQDVMINNEAFHNFFEKLPSPKDLVEYPDEGHCCNFKLNDVRNLSMKWFSSKGDGLK